MLGFLKEKLKKIAEEVVKKVEEKPSKLIEKLKYRELEQKDIEPILEEAKIELIEADVALEVAEKIKNDLIQSLVGKKVKKGEEKEVVTNALKQSLLEILDVPRIDLEEVIKKAKSENRPAVLLFFGVNGVGKSLTLSKVAYFLKNKGYRPILGAGDTFRAAGSLQLEEYGKEIGVPTISQKQYSDSCAVIFDTINAAKARGHDVVLADTSGRMHTKKDLMNELAKIVRVNKPDLKILVLDSLSGSDVLMQYDFFDKAVGIDAIIFSKVDVNEKGGNILSVCYKYKKPILFLGTGQKYEDLEVYDPKKFVEKLIG